jgi:hypothetical protein
VNNKAAIDGLQCQGIPNGKTLTLWTGWASVLEESVDISVGCHLDMPHGMHGQRRTPKQHVKSLGGEDAQGQDLPLEQNLRQEGKPYTEKGRGAIFTLVVFRPRIWQGTKLGQYQNQMKPTGGRLNQHPKSYVRQGASAHCSTLRP